MNTAQLLEQFATDVAAALPEIDAEATHSTYGDGIGCHDERTQVARIKNTLRDIHLRYSGFETEVPYPATGRKCDLVLEVDDGRLPIEAKLLRFNRANGDIESNAYGTIFSPLKGSLVMDAEKLVGSGFETPGGLLGLYYERGDEEAPVFDPERLAEKVALEIGYWTGCNAEVRKVAPVSGLRHEVHQQGAVITWELEP